MKPKHQRLIFIAFSMIFMVAAVLLTMQAFRENLVFFYSPSDLSQLSEKPSGLIRIGGLVEAGSINKLNEDSLSFSVTDGQDSIQVEYTGLLPTLFREGQGVVAEGNITGIKHFTASRILTKHDENYMPKEVVDSLKKTGRWQESR